MPAMGGCVGIGGNEICLWLVCLWDDRNGSAQSSCWLVYSPFFGVGRSSPDTPTKEREPRLSLLYVYGTLVSITSSLSGRSWDRGEKGADRWQSRDRGSWF